LVPWCTSRCPAPGLHQQPQQRRLAGAVGPDQADAIAAADANRKVAHHRHGAVRLADAIGFEDHVPGSVGDLDLQADVADLSAAGRALGAHRHQRADPAFVAGPPRFDAAAQPHFLARHRLVELLFGRRFVGEPGSFLVDERRVTARPRRQPAAIELDDPGRQAIEKRAVVRHEDHGAGIVGDLGFQPLDRLDIEVVGRLVEEQQRRLRDQHARQQHAAAPAAGQRLHQRVGWQGQPGQHQLDALLDPPAVPLFQLVLQPAKRGQRVIRGTLGNRDRGMVYLVSRSLKSPRPSATTSNTDLIGRDGGVLNQPRPWRDSAPARSGHDRERARPRAPVTAWTSPRRCVRSPRRARPTRS
jgi:hypothetical protein